MESNWGENVGHLGLGGTGATLAARFRAFPWIVVTNGWTFDRDSLTVWITDPDTDLAWIPLVTDKAAFPVNFPYGLDVEPIVHL